MRTLEALISAFANVGVHFERDGVRALAAPTRETVQAANSDVGPLMRITFRSLMELSRVASMKATLGDIESKCRAHNTRDRITGIVMMRDGAILAALEGPRTRLPSLLDDIRADPRHHQVEVIENREIAARFFEDWTFCCGVFPSDDALIGGETALQGGFHPEHLSPAATLGLLTLIRELQHQSPRTGRTSILRCPLDRACRDRICASGAGSG